MGYFRKKDTSPLEVMTECIKATGTSNGMCDMHTSK